MAVHTHRCIRPSDFRRYRGNCSVFIPPTTPPSTPLRAARNAARNPPGTPPLESISGGAFNPSDIFLNHRWRNQLSGRLKEVAPKGGYRGPTLSRSDDVTDSRLKFPVLTVHRSADREDEIRFAQLFVCSTNRNTCGIRSSVILRALDLARDTFCRSRSLEIKMSAESLLPVACACKRYWRTRRLHRRMAKLR